MRTVDGSRKVSNPGPGYGRTQEEIIIERRQIVARLTLGDSGTPALAAAFTAAGEYLANHDDMEGVSLAFDLYGRTFTAGVDAVDPVESNGETLPAY